MKQTNKTPDFQAIAKELLEKRPVMVAVESQKFFKECFVKEGWTDNGFQPWQKRISPLGGNKILIGGAGANAMNLMQSIRTLYQSADRVSTGTTLSYARYHNNGATATVTAQSKKYWWAMYYKFAGKQAKTKTGKLSKSAKNLAVNAKAEYCKNMALMKVGSKIKIPRRQFIGESQTLLSQFELWWQNEIKKQTNL